MNRKGFAVSGILYTILLIFLAIIYMLLMNFKNKKNLLDQIKSEVLFNSKLCEEKVGQTFTFDYTGEAQEFIVECEGEYKIELWGASGNTTNPTTFTEGGTTYNGGLGGKGAYTSGKIDLSKDTKLYVYIGGNGTPSTSRTESNGGGYNGGGNNRLTKNNSAYSGTGGGGATDIRFFGTTIPTDQDLLWNSDLGLKNRIMVAGAGGGGASWNQAGGAGGGLIGYNGVPDPRSTAHVAGGGTQTTGGVASGCGTSDSNNSWCSQTIEAGSFGKGGSAIPQADGGPGGSGGAGYYGGGAGGDGYSFSGAGGSSYISGHAGSLAIASSENLSLKDGCTASSNDVECSKHFSGLYFTDTKMIDGAGYEWTTEKGSEVVSMPTHDGESTMTGNTGNGYAKITYLGKKVVRTCEIDPGTEYTFDYTGDTQNFEVPCNGYYKVELWGAQGGGTVSNSRGGYGAYTSGSISLNKNDNLYLYVGNQPARTENAFNGGGLANNTNYPSDDGGGATDIRYFGNSTPSSSDLAWDSNVGLNSRIMVAAAGGGGTAHSSYLAIGGAGGGLTGYSGKSSNSSGASYVATGGTQTAGGTKDTSSTYPGFAGEFGKGGNGEGYNKSVYGGGGGGSGSVHGLHDAGRAGFGGGIAEEGGAACGDPGVY